MIIRKVMEPLPKFSCRRVRLTVDARGSEYDGIHLEGYIFRRIEERELDPGRNTCMPVYLLHEYKIFTIGGYLERSVEALNLGTRRDGHRRGLTRRNDNNELMAVEATGYWRTQEAIAVHTIIVDCLKDYDRPVMILIDNENDYEACAVFERAVEACGIEMKQRFWPTEGEQKPAKKKTKR